MYALLLGMNVLGVCGSWCLPLGMKLLWIDSNVFVDACTVFDLLSSMERDALLELVAAAEEEEGVREFIVKYIQMRPLHLANGTLCGVMLMCHNACGFVRLLLLSSGVGHATMFAEFGG